MFDGRNGVPAAGRSPRPTAGAGLCLHTTRWQAGVASLRAQQTSLGICRSGLVGSFARGGIGVGAPVDDGRLHIGRHPGRR